MTETNSATGKVTSIGQMAYRKLTDALSQLTNEWKTSKNQ